MINTLSKYVMGFVQLVATAPVNWDGFVFRLLFVVGIHSFNVCLGFWNSFNCSLDSVINK